MPFKGNGANIILVQFQGSSWRVCLPDGWERFTEIHYCCSPVHLQPAAYLEYLVIRNRSLFSVLLSFANPPLHFPIERNYI